MSNKKSCCDFFKKAFKKDRPHNQNTNPISTTIKTSFEENTEIIGKNTPIKEESKINKFISSEGSLNIIESDPNSFFYDKNSALVEITDKNKALENLKEAYGIINKEYEDQSAKSQREKPIDAKERFTKVIVGINFKEILEGEESIVISERSDISNIYSIAAND